MDTPDANEFSVILADVRTKLGYQMPLDVIHADLVCNKGLSPEAAHFIIRAVQFREG